MGNISRTLVGLRIFGEDLIPDEVTKLLRCEPTKSARKGDRIGIRDNPKISKTGFWLLDVDEKDNSEIEQKVDNLLNQLTDDLSIWEQITRRFDVDIFCGLFLENFNEGFILSPSVIKKLYDRKIEIGFDVYLP